MSLFDDMCNDPIPKIIADGLVTSAEQVMAFDPSKILYPHYVCGQLPCTCPPKNHKNLEFTLMKCRVDTCLRTFMSETERAEHHLSEHEVPYTYYAVTIPLPEYTNGVHHG